MFKAIKEVFHVRRSKMSTKDNWALYINEGKIQWQFGDLKKTVLVQNLIDALDQFGNQILGEGIASLTIRPESRPFSYPITVLIVRLAENIYFICSQPETTAKLLFYTDIPDLIEDQLRGVLIGATLNHYSKYWGSLLYQHHQQLVDKIYNTCIEAIGAEDRVKIKEGNCSLSPLSIQELIQFHHFLRLSLEQNEDMLSPQEWALVFHRHGVPLHFYWNLDTQMAISLAAFISLVYNFAEESFGQASASMTFGSTEILKLDFVTGKEYILCATQSKRLFLNRDFLQHFRQIPPEAFQDIQANLTEFLTKIVSEAYRQQLTEKDVDSLIDVYRNIAGPLEKEYLAYETLMEQNFQLITQIKTKILEHTISVPPPDTPLKIVVLGSTEAFTKQYLQKSLNEITVSSWYVGDRPIPVITGKYAPKNCQMQFWVIPYDILVSDTASWISLVTSDNDALLIPLLAETFISFTRVKTLIEFWWTYSGKTALNTIILAVDPPKEFNPKKPFNLPNLLHDYNLFRKVLAPEIQNRILLVTTSLNEQNERDNSFDLLYYHILSTKHQS